MNPDPLDNLRMELRRGSLVLAEIAGWIHALAPVKPPSAPAAVR